MHNVTFSADSHRLLRVPTRLLRVRQTLTVFCGLLSDLQDPKRQGENVNISRCYKSDAGANRARLWGRHCNSAISRLVLALRAAGLVGPPQPVAVFPLALALASVLGLVRPPAMLLAVAPRADVLPAVPRRSTSACC